MNLMQPVYYEDLKEGQVFTSPGRTITEADLTLFAMVSGDWNQIHTNEAYAQGTVYGKRVVHGPLGVAITIGLFGRLGDFEKTAIALLDIRDWKFIAPIFIGDTLHIEVRIVSKRLTSDQKRGIVDRHIRLLRHDGAVVQEGHMGLMIAVRPAAAGG